MARPSNPNPTASVRKIESNGVVTHVAWTVYFTKNGVPDRKQGKISVQRHAAAHAIGSSHKQKVAAAESAAHAAAQAFIGELANGGVGRKEYTVESWCRYYCEHVLALQASPDYATIACQTLELHVFPLLGAVKLRDLTAEQLEAYFRWRRETPSAAPIRNRRGEVIGQKAPKLLGWKTLDLLRGYLRRCLDAAYARGHVAIKLLSQVAYDRNAAKEYREDLKKRKQWFSDAIVRRLLTEAKGVTLRALVLVQVDLGVRAGEACGVRLEDVDFATGRIEVKQQLRRSRKKYNGPTSVQEKEPKGDGARLAFASEELLAFVSLRIEEEMKKPEAARCPYIVISPEGGPLEPNRAAKMFRLFCQMQGIPLKKGNATHAIRRTVLDAAKMAPVSPATKALFGGHDEYETSEKVYHQLNDLQIAELKTVQESLHARFRSASPSSPLPSPPNG